MVVLVCGGRHNSSYSFTASVLVYFSPNTNKPVHIFLHYVTGIDAVARIFVCQPVQDSPFSLEVYRKTNQQISLAI
jgi:hypothetical protein